MRADRPAATFGTPAWLRALILALFVALALPALAVGAGEAGPVVLDLPVAESPIPADAVLDVPASEVPPPAPDPVPGEIPPVADQPTVIDTPPPAVDTLPLVDIAVPVELVTTPVIRPEPIVTAQPPAPAPSTPVVLTDVALPGPSPIAQPPAAPVVVLPPTLTPPSAGPALAPELPELVPGGPTLPPAPSMLMVVAAPPSEAGTIRLPGGDVVPADLGVPPTPGVAAALGIPNTSPAVSIGPPQIPTFAPLFGPATGMVPSIGTRQTIADFAAILLGPSSPRDPIALAARPASGTRGTDGDERSTGSTIFDAQLVAPTDTAPAGSSLLAILAGYALPGGGGAPASTLVLFIVVGLIVGLGYAACAQGTERIALGRLLGAASGHRPAVCRPG